MYKRLRVWLKKIGPGFVSGAADDDPSGIGTFSQTGALFGYGQLWLTLFSLPFMIVVQEMCGRIGMVTGKGLSGVIKKHYPKTVLYLAISLLVIANTINIGADLAAMAASARMVLGLPFSFWLIFMAALILILVIFTTYESYARILKYLALTLLSYVVTAFIVKQDWAEVLKSTVAPQIVISRDYILNVVAILGTTISPYLFFWQSNEEIEKEIVDGKLREVGEGTPRISRVDIAGMRMDTVIGMFFSQIVVYFIILTTASTLFAHGIRNIETAPQAAEALRPLAGDLAYLLFALGIIGTGLLAVPILAGSAAYAVSEAVGWKMGLSKRLGKARGFYGVIIVSTICGLLIDSLEINPIRALYYSAALNGLIAPLLMVLIMLIANQKKIMGQYTNKRIQNILGWLIIILMSVCGIALVADMLTGAFSGK